jgi:type IV secretion system protein VirB6
MASFLSEVETAITGQLATVSGATVGLATAAQPAFLAGLTIWILLTGYEVALGKTQDSVTYIFTKLGKMALLGWLALWAWPDIASILSGLRDAALGGGGSASGVIEATVLDPLVALWTAMQTWFATATQDLGFTDLPKYLTLVFMYLLMVIAFGLLVLVAGAMAAVSFGMFMIAQVMFALHLAVGAFFVLCLMFPFTQRFFETFIGSAMTTIFALVLTTIVLNLGANVLGLNGALAGALTGPATVDDTGFIAYARSAAVLFLAKAGAAALLIYMFFKVWDLAAALGGGINMGNNIVSGARGIMADVASGGKGGGNRSTANNSITNGGSGGGASQRAANANSGATFTGSAVRGAGAAAGALGRAFSPAARLAAGGVQNAAQIASYGAGRAVGAGAAAGRLAYNRYSQSRKSGGAT